MADKVNPMSKAASQDKLRHSDKLAKVLKYMHRPGYTAQYAWVLYTLADMTNKTTGDAWPSIRHIAERTWISERQVSRIINVLERDGLLKIKRKFNGSSRYVVVIPEIPTDVREQGEEQVFGGVGAKDEIGHELSGDWVDPLSGDGVHPPLREPYHPAMEPYPSVERALPPVPSAVPPRSHSVLTSNQPPLKTSNKNLELEPQPWPVPVPVSGLDSSLRERLFEPEDNCNSNDQDPIPLPVNFGPKDPTPRDAPSPSAAAVAELATGLKELFPAMKIFDVDLSDLLEQQGINPAKVLQVVRWAKDRSNGRWKEDMVDSDYLLLNFSTMANQRQKYMHTVAANRQAKRPA